jgi:RimJ/RimL family protein N-acetyltransferase
MLLRALQRTDWPIDYALSRDPAVLSGTTFPRCLSQEEARQRVDRAIRRRTEGQSARYVIERDGDIAGIAGVSARPHNDVEIYYALLPAARGHGIATRAARLLTAWAVAAGAGRVVLVTFPEIAASQRTAARAGFVRVGQEPRASPERHREVQLWVHRQPGVARMCGPAS